MQVSPEPDRRLEARIARDPRYHALVRERQRFSWVLTAITVIVYSSFIACIAFDKPLMARPIGSGSTSIAVVAGIAMLVGTVVICGVYVWRANGRYDRVLTEMLADNAA